MAAPPLQADGGEPVAVVTGGVRGIGAAIVAALAADGARVAVLDVVPSSTEDADASAALAVTCDVADPESVDAAFTRVEAELGPVSILVNNAGVLRTGLVDGLDLEAWRTTFDVNVIGAMLCCRRALPGMRAAGHGRIVCVGSSAGKTGGGGGLAAYGASKAAMMSLARAIGVEYAGEGITSNAVAPAAIATEMIADLGVTPDAIPVGRLGRPEDVARAVAFLCSPDASYVTAEVLDVNGGFLVD